MGGLRTFLMVQRQKNVKEMSVSKVSNVLLHMLHYNLLQNYKITMNLNCTILIAENDERGATRRFCKKFQQLKTDFNPPLQKEECAETTSYGEKYTTCTCATHLCNKSASAKGGIVCILALLTFVLLTL